MELGLLLIVIGLTIAILVSNALGILVIIIGLVLLLAPVVRRSEWRSRL